MKQQEMLMHQGALIRGMPLKILDRSHFSICMPGNEPASVSSPGPPLSCR